MKIPLLIVAATVGVALTFAIPQFGGACDVRTQAASSAELEPLALDTTSAHPQRLRVEAGPETAVDRGHLGNFHTPRELCGAYRYQQEREHRVLYVYDEVQNLVARVVDPASVTVLGQAQ